MERATDNDFYRSHIWHYAVFTARNPQYYEPACTLDRTELRPRQSDLHAITIVRGHVNCPDCMRAMGMIVSKKCQHEMTHHMETKTVGEGVYRRLVRHEVCDGCDTTTAIW